MLIDEWGCNQVLKDGSEDLVELLKVLELILETRTYRDSAETNNWFST